MDQIIEAENSREKAVDKLVQLSLAAGGLEHLTDKYFSNTAKIVAAGGDAQVTYAIFLRRRSIAALEPAIKLLQYLVPEAAVERFCDEGEIIPAEKKLIEITGPLTKLSEVETLMLQKIGLPCVCADNAYEMVRAMPEAAFLDMHARHGSGAEMNLMAAYGAAIGSDAAKRSNEAVRGFIGSSQDLTAPMFGAAGGLGTMPHALIGYTDGDVLEATKLFAAELPDAGSIFSLVDYSGHEVTDSVRCARWFFEEAGLDTKGKTFGVRLDTHGGRFAEGLDYEKSVETVGEWLKIEGEYNIVEEVLGQRAFQMDRDNILVDQVRRILFGSGVSTASIIHTRKALNLAGFPQTKIVASSGFGLQKCLVMGAARAPVDMVGSGSFLPATLTETYATADIIAYDGVPRVKTGREFLFEGR